MVDGRGHEETVWCGHANVWPHYAGSGANSADTGTVWESEATVEVDGWFDIYDINRGFLAWSNNDPRSRQGWKIASDDNPAYRFVDIGEKGRWYFHLSEAGLRELLTKMYGDEQLVQFHSRQPVVSIWVPKGDIGYWIGRNGFNVKRMAEWLGLERVSIYPH